MTGGSTAAVGMSAAEFVAVVSLAEDSGPR